MVYEIINLIIEMAYTECDLQGLPRSIESIKKLNAELEKKQ